MGHMGLSDLRKLQVNYHDVYTSTQLVIQMLYHQLFVQNIL